MYMHIPIFHYLLTDYHFYLTYATVADRPYQDSQPESLTGNPCDMTGPGLF